MFACDCFESFLPAGIPQLKLIKLIITVLSKECKVASDRDYLSFIEFLSKKCLEDRCLANTGLTNKADFEESFVLKVPFDYFQKSVVLSLGFDICAATWADVALLSMLFETLLAYTVPARYYHDRASRRRVEPTVADWAIHFRHACNKYYTSITQHLKE